MRERKSVCTVAAFGILFAFAFISCDDSSGMKSAIEKPDTTESNHILWCKKNCQWIYSQMKHHYFWNNDIPDSLSLDFTLEPHKFFPLLLSTEDRFSWCERNTSYRSDTLERDLGFEYQPYIDANGALIYQILMCDKEVTSRHAMLKRGTWCRFSLPQGSSSPFHITTGHIDKGCFVSGSTFLYATSPSRNKMLNATVLIDSVYTIANHKIGYIFYKAFESENDVIDAVIKMKLQNIDELILDLRYNGGGLVNTANYLCSVIVPPQYLGKTLISMRYNDIITKELIQETGKDREYEYFMDSYNVKTRNLHLSRLFVLTTAHTASASELTIFSLRPYLEVITIGETTRGKDVGSYTIKDNRYKYQLQPITFRDYNAQGDSIPITGIVPNYATVDSIGHELGDTAESLLHAAIHYIETGQFDTIATAHVKSFYHSTYPRKEGLSSIEMKRLYPQERERHISTK